MKYVGGMNSRLDADGQNHEKALYEESVQMEKEFQIDERRFKQLLGVVSDLSGAIRDLAAATASQRPPIVLNVMANNDDDLKKFATVFAQGIK